MCSPAVGRDSVRAVVEGEAIVVLACEVMCMMLELRVLGSVMSQLCDVCCVMT